jgi:hypothetical protein
MKPRKVQPVRINRFLWVGRPLSGRNREPRHNDAWWKDSVSGLVVVQSQADLLEMVLALAAACSFTSLLDGWKKDGNQDRDDRDHDE